MCIIGGIVAIVVAKINFRFERLSRVWEAYIMWMFKKVKI